MEEIEIGDGAEGGQLNLLDDKELAEYYLSLKSFQSNAINSAKSELQQRGLLIPKRS